MLLPITFGLFFLPSAPIVITTAFTVLWCGANGVIVIARVTLPLTLLGSAGYGTLMGKLALPQNLAYAISPTIFAVVFSRLGLGATVALAARVSLAAAFGVIGLARLVTLCARSSGVHTSTLTASSQ
jgi:hypothetical protein